MRYFAIQIADKIDWIQIYNNEADADAHCREYSGYAPLTERDDPDHYKKYDPPIWLLFEGKDDSALDTHKFTRPVAVYLRGERFTCIPEDDRLA